MANITNSLLDALDEINTGKFDVKKIKATNQTVNTILNVFRTEAAILKMKEGK